MFNRYSFRQIEFVLFLILLGLFLAPVWLNKFFLTVDGPCHIYNSKIVLDFITSSNLDFYKEYYEFNTNLEPNWFSHISLAFLLSVLPTYLAEKVFITAYVILYATGLRLLLKTIGKENVFLAILGLLFIFNRTFQMGFYNYSFGFVFFFFSLWYWLNNAKNFTKSKIFVYAILNTVLYFAHPIGFFLAVLCIGSIALFETLGIFINNKDSQTQSYSSLFNPYIKLIASFLPATILMGEYIYRKGLNPTANPDSFNKILYPFLELTSVIILTKEEKIWAILLSVLFLITLAYAVYFKIRLRNFGKFDVFFSVFVLMLFVYFNQPGQMAGAGVLTVRLQFIPFLMLLLWFANINFNITIKKIFVGIVFTIGLILTIIRYPHHKLASEAIEEYLTVQGHIEDKSTVLPLSFSHRGKTPEGKYIADRIGLFKHASDYLGADKSLILFGNYEANTGYFPLIWKKEKNPFRNISTNQGIEYQPPSVDIINYHTKTGGEIDYVITWCLDEKFMEHEYTKNTLQQLEMEYVLHFTSINGRVKLYKKKLRS